MSFGHKHFVFTTPPLQGTKTGEEFADHLAAMAERLHTWDIHATQVIVDERQRSVVVRGDFRMTPIPGETVVNDVVIIMSMDESGERLVECTEFVDPVAAGEIRRLMVAKE
jgi:ketosteroid isomerase-like protein